jgi:hypothetical protein
MPTATAADRVSGSVIERDQERSVSNQQTGSRGPAPRVHFSWRPCVRDLGGGCTRFQVWENISAEGIAWASARPLLLGAAKAIMTSGRQTDHSSVGFIGGW